MDLRELAIITIPVILTGLLGFLAWVTLTIQKNNISIKVLEATTDAQLKQLQRSVDIAVKQIWKAEQQLEALWPLVPGANERFSDKSKLTTKF